MIVYEKHKIIKFKDLDYTNDIFTTTAFNENFENLIYSDSFFPKFKILTKK